MTAIAFWIPVILMAVGILLVLRAAAVVTVKSEGRFRGDALVTTLGGFALILLGQFLLTD